MQFIIDKAFKKQSRLLEMHQRAFCLKWTPVFCIWAKAKRKTKQKKMRNIKRL